MMTAGDKTIDPGWVLINEQGDEVYFSASTVSAIRCRYEGELGARRMTYAEIVTGSEVNRYAPQQAAPVLRFFRDRIKGQQGYTARLGDHQS